MTISFDLDSTLIPHNNEFQTEKPTFKARLLGVENLRKGTIKLFQQLEADGHQIWIYTTSFRSIFKLKLLFKSYGLHPKKYINETINRKRLDAANCKASKNAKLFAIDLHIDDSEGVGIEARKYEFNAFIISPKNENWVDDILKYIQQFPK